MAVQRAAICPIYKPVIPIPRSADCAAFIVDAAAVEGCNTVVDAAAAVMECNTVVVAAAAAECMLWRLVGVLRSWMDVL